MIYNHIEAVKKLESGRFSNVGMAVPQESDVEKITEIVEKYLPNGEYTTENGRLALNSVIPFKTYFETVGVVKKLNLTNLRIITNPDEFVLFMHQYGVGAIGLAPCVKQTVDAALEKLDMSQRTFKVVYVEPKK